MNQAVKMSAIFVKREMGTGKIPKNNYFICILCLDYGMFSSFSFFLSTLVNNIYFSGRRSITFGQRVHMGLKNCPVMQI